MSTLPQISPELIKKYQAEIANSSSEATAKRKSASLNKFFGWAEEEGHIAASPMPVMPQVTTTSVTGTSKPQKKVTLKTWALLGTTLGLIVLIFLLTWKVGFPIEFIKNFAAGVDSNPTAKITIDNQNVLPKSSSPSAVISASPAGNGSWNLYAKIKLTNSDNQPQVGSETLTFKLFGSETGGTSLYASSSQSVTTDSSGSTLISLDGVPGDLFFDNHQLFLEPQTGSSSASPRVPISTANVAANLGGYFPADPTIGAAELTIPVIDASGSLNLASTSPALKAKDGNLLIQGQALTLKTADGGNGNIEINPDGSGYAHFLFEGSKGNFLNAQGPNLNSGSLYYGMVPNSSTGYDLIRLQSGAPKMTTKFSVGALGDTYIAKDLNVKEDIATNGVDRLTSSGALQNITGYSQNSGNFVINQNPGDFASIVKTGAALNNTLNLTLDETGVPTNSNYSTLVLNRINPGSGGMALVVNGNSTFNGQLKLGNFASNPDNIGTGSLVYNTSDNQVYVWNGTVWTTMGGGSSAFNDITSGTNTTANMVVGSGATLSFTGTGTIEASDVTCAGCVSNSELANSSITFAGETGSTAIALGGTENITGGATITTAQTGSTLSIDVTDDSLDFAQFQDALDLDASTDIALGGLTLSTSGTGPLSFNSTGQVTFAGNVDATNGLDVTNDSSFTASGFFSLGDNGETGFINTSDWDINTSGDLSGIGTIGADGDITLTQATPSIFFVDNTAASDDFSVNVDASNFTIVNSTDARTDVLIDGTGNATLGANLTITGDLFANGSTTLGNAITDNITFTARVAQDSDLIPITTTGTNDLGSLALPWDDIYGVALFQNGNPVCDSTGTNCPAGSTQYWDQVAGALYPLSNSVDVLIGGSATASAKFRFQNVAAGTPTASISGSIANVSTFLTGDGNLATTNMQGLTLGGSTTGDITLQPRGTAVTGNVQIGAGGAGSTTPDLLVLDLKSNAGDPTGSNGSVYYNASSNKFRCFEAAAWTNCIGSGSGSSSWSSLTDPSADLTLAMSTWNTIFNWDPGADSAETNFTLTTQGEDTLGSDEDQVLLALSQTSNGVDVTQAADALLTFANNDANDPVGSAIRFDAGAAGTDFTYGINFDAASIGTAELILQNSETIDNTVDGSVNIGATTLELTGGTTIHSNQATVALLNTTTTTLNLGGAATTINMGPTGSGASSILLSGGSGDTGCTLNGANGNLTCSGNITTTATSGTQGWWQLNGNDLSPTSAGYSLAIGGTTSAAPFYVDAATGNVAGGTINTNVVNSTTFNFSGANPNITASTVNTNINLNANGSGTVNLAGTSTGDILFGGGSASTGCTVTNSTGDFTCSGDIAVNGGDLTTSATTATLFNATATTLSLGGAAATLNIGPTGSAAGSILFAGGSADTGCTINDATGALTCAGFVAAGGVGQFGGTTALAYSRFGTATSGHGLSTSDDLLIGNNLELNGVLYLDGSVIANSSGTAFLTFSATPTTTASVLTASNWLIENTANVGQAALIVNQTKAGDIFTASSSGTPKFTIANNGNVSISGSGTMLTVGGGTGKIDVGTVDPPYTINGKKYATYLSATVGVKEETVGQAQTAQYIPGIGYRFVVDFNAQPEGSDLWLFGKTTNIKENIENLSALLTPSSPTNVWYEVDKANDRLLVYSARPTQVSYRLTAPRFNADEYGNRRGDDSHSVGFVINSPDIAKTINEVINVQKISDFIVEKTGNAGYILKNGAGQIVDGVDSIGNFVAGNVRAGAIETKELTVNEFKSATAVVDNLLVRSGLVASNIQTQLISPLPDGHDITVRLGNEASSSGKFAIQNYSGDEVAAIDSVGNATFSGEVHAKNIDEIQDILSQVQTNQALLDDLASSTNLNASNSANLSQVVTHDLFVTDQAAINSLSIADSFSLGSDFVFQGTDSSINTLTSPLRLQSLAGAPIELMAGLVTIDTQGNVNIAGNLHVAGTITTPKAEVKDLAIQNLTIAASTEATPSGQVTSGEIQTNATAGTAVIPTGTTEITIKNPKVSSYTLVYITPTSETNNYVLYIKSKQDGQFVVGFSNPIPVDVNFNWWIVQVQ